MYYVFRLSEEHNTFFVPEKFESLADARSAIVVWREDMPNITYQIVEIVEEYKP